MDTIHHWRSRQTPPMSCIQPACSPGLVRVDVLDALGFIQDHSVKLRFGVQQRAAARELPIRFRVCTRVLLNPLINYSISQEVFKMTGRAQAEKKKRGGGAKVEGPFCPEDACLRTFA